MLKGGVADKLGNAFEAQWTLLEALCVLRGEAAEIRLEPFNEDANGLEFRVSRRGRHVWHQCKRGVTSGNWTLQRLESVGVLKDFARKLQDQANSCVFVSTDPAPQLKGLIDKAAMVESPKDLVDSSSLEDSRAYRALRDVWGRDDETIFAWLKHCSIETVSEASMTRELRTTVSSMFVGDADAVIERLLLYLGRKLTQTLTPEVFRGDIDNLGLVWKARLDATLDERLAVATDRYLETLSAPIGDTLIETQELREAADICLLPRPRVVIFAGRAGCGKSAAAERVIGAARAAAHPVLAFRIDQFLGAESVEALGTSLFGRPESPVSVVGNRYSGRPAVLLIDQVDAVSEASGRSGRIAEVLFQLVEESNIYRELQLVIACRTYDLEHDSRLTRLAKRDGVRVIKLELLDWEVEVFPRLKALGLTERPFSEQDRQILCVPINLKMLGDLMAAGGRLEGEISGSGLFDRLLGERARQLRAAGVVWTPGEALGLMAQSMSDTQELTAPKSLLRALPGALDLLSSYGLIKVTGERLQFAHESYFDNAFSGHFVSTGNSVLELLLGGEQRLFRRTQVRQIFARMREEAGERAYNRNLREVMTASAVRYLVKDAIAAWLSTVAEPTDAELRIVAEWLDPSHLQVKLARTVISGRSWLPRLIRSGLLRRWLDAGDRDADYALRLLAANGGRHSELTAALLRDWWSGRADRLDTVLHWFNMAQAPSTFGPLEQLYVDLVAAYAPTVDGVGNGLVTLDLANLASADPALAARMYGIWLRRQADFVPAEQLFALGIGQDVPYWVQETAKTQPLAFLEAVLPVFASALVHDLAQSNDNTYARNFKIPSSHLEESWLHRIVTALELAPASHPRETIILLQALPAGEVATFLRLRAIAANGEALGHLLITSLGEPKLLDLGDTDGGWLPFAKAAKAAFPSLTDADRARIEHVVHAHRPEHDRAKWYLNWAREGGAGRNPRATARHYLSRSGAEERALLMTVGVEQLSRSARTRLAELERKFPGEPLPEAFGLRGGWVGSPIDAQRVAKMTDRQWLRAIDRYASEDEHRFEKDGVIGGASALSTMLMGRVKEQPARFVALLDQLPATSNPAYPRAVLSGLRECAADAETVVKAIQLSDRWTDDEIPTQLCWLVQAHPAAAEEPSILERMLTSAEHGTTSRMTITSTATAEAPKTMIAERLQNDDRRSMVGLNGERGAAYEALARGVWENERLLEPVADLLERRAITETSLPVRMCMLDALNSVCKYAPIRGLEILDTLVRQDVDVVRCQAARHILGWATAAYSEATQDLMGLLQASPDESLRVLGLFLESGPAIGDDLRAAAFTEKFGSDPLCRQVGAFRAGGNLSPDRVGDRASRWLHEFFDDPEFLVRAETARIHWEQALDGGADLTALAERFVRSAAFDERSDGLVRALGERPERFPDLTFLALERILKFKVGREGPRRERHFLTLHNLGKLLVGLYRMADSDPEREAALLDLFDLYLSSDEYRISSDLSAYERL